MFYDTDIDTHADKFQKCRPEVLVGDPKTHPLILL